MGIKKDSPGIRVAIKVTPNAGSNEITGYKDEILQVKVAVAPEKGKANKALVNLLAKKLGVRKSSIAIIKGETSRKKVILFNGIRNEELIKKLNTPG